MQCIINAGNCLHNRTGLCEDKPNTEYIPCFGTVCFNIKVKEAGSVDCMVVADPGRNRGRKPRRHNSKNVF